MERQQAKRHPDHKVAQDAVRRNAHALRASDDHLQRVEKDVLQRYNVAFHEIRKMNGAVKTAAERIARREAPDDPDTASKEVVQIWKTSELMSKQFDVLEILANETLARLPLNTISEIYRIFDKCARIYRARPGAPRIGLYAPSGFNVRIRACDKTLAIIPSVLIENAVKYAVASSEVRIEFSESKDHCEVRVVNNTRAVSNLPANIFAKGVRGTSTGEGSGNGLYVAQLVARQHGGQIVAEGTRIGDQLRCIFAIRFSVVN